MEINVAYTFEDYIVFCKLTNQKPSYYKSLLDFKQFVRQCNGGLIM